MSDVLTRLAERSVGRPPAVQPVLPSLFEPAPDEGFVQGIEEMETLGPVSRRADDPNLKPAPSWPEPVPAPSSPVVAAARENAPVGLGEGPRAAAEPVRRSVESPAATGPIPPPVRPEAPTVAPLSRAVERPVPVPAAAPDSPSRKDAPAPDPIRPSRASAPALTAPAAPSPRGALAVTPHRPDLTPRVEIPAPSSSPAVRVTIGRVEVRAVLPPAPPAPPAAPASVDTRLSLDEYLKTRGEGQR
ncbi:MAG TPA: hypothetical protein VGM37_17585 [Armatimonadota bacterium]